VEGAVGVGGEDPDDPLLERDEPDLHVSRHQPEGDVVLVEAAVPEGEELVGAGVGGRGRGGVRRHGGDLTLRPAAGGGEEEDGDGGCAEEA